MQLCKCSPYSCVGFHFQFPSPCISIGVDNNSKSTTVKRTRNLKTVRAMRAVVQRVASASVEVDGRVVSEIGPGLLVLVGIHDSDGTIDADYICRKVLNMRLFPNETTDKAWDLSVMQKNYQVLLGKLNSVHILMNLNYGKKRMIFCNLFFLGL